MFASTWMVVICALLVTQNCLAAARTLTDSSDHCCTLLSVCLNANMTATTLRTLLDAHSSKPALTTSPSTLPTTAVVTSTETIAAPPLDTNLFVQNQPTAPSSPPPEVQSVFFSPPIQTSTPVSPSYLPSTDVITTEPWSAWFNDFCTLAKAFFGHTMTQVFTALLTVLFTGLIVAVVVLLRKVYKLTSDLMLLEDMANIFCICNETATTPCRPACKFYRHALYNGGLTTQDLDRHQNDFLVKLGVVLPRFHRDQVPFRRPSTPSVWTRIFSNRHARLLDPANYVEMSTIDDHTPIVRTDRLLEQLRTLQESHNQLLTAMNQLKSTPSELSTTPPPPSAAHSDSDLHTRDPLTPEEREAAAIALIRRSRSAASAALAGRTQPPRDPPANAIPPTPRLPQPVPTTPAPNATTPLPDAH